MTPLAIERVWEALLPAASRFSAGFEPTTIALDAGDELTLAGAGQRRRREFATGRWHARQALQRLGVDGGELPRLTDGRVAWPAGVCGSLSHTTHRGRSFAVATVAEVAAVSSGDTGLSAIGVDVEAPGRIEPRAWSSLLSGAELERIVALRPADRSAVVMALWCGAEAAFKAGHRLPTEPDARDPDDGRSLFTMTQVNTTSGSHALRWSEGDIEVRVVCDAGWTCAAAWRAG